MAEEGNSAGPSGIVKIKDNFVKITKDRKKFVFVAAKSFELVFLLVAALAESYKALFVVSYRHPNKLPDYKNWSYKNLDINFRIVVIGLDGFIIINLVLLICYRLGEQLPRKMLGIFSLLGAMFCFGTGMILLTDSGDSNHYLNDPASNELIVAAVFAFIASLVFLVETIVTFKFLS